MGYEARNVVFVAFYETDKFESRKKKAGAVVNTAMTIWMDL
jgi:hypothetical protein